MNAKLIEALKGVRDNLNVIIDVLGEDVPVVTEAEAVVEEKVTRHKRTPKEEAPVAPAVTESSVTGTLDREQLDGMSYNDLKKLAKSMGITATGARDELTDKILNTEVNVSATEEAEEEAPVKKTRTRKAKTPEPEESDEPDEEEDLIVTQVNEAVADMGDEDILDFLADVGVKAKGKRQALIAHVVKAVKEGKIELDDGEDEEEEETPAPAPVPKPEKTKKSKAEKPAPKSDEEEDPNDLDNADMTDARRNALEVYAEETTTSFEDGDITREEMIDWINEYKDTNDTMKKVSDEDVLALYINLSSLLIDDDGDIVEEGAYTLNGNPYCCGSPLKYNKRRSVYICERCGTEYEAEEE